MRAKSAFFCDATFVSLNVLAWEHALIILLENARRKYFPTKRRTPRARFIFASSACLLYADTQTNASFIFSTSPFYLFFSLSRGSVWVIGFSLAVMQSSRRFEILFVRFPFSEFRAFSWCQTREREIYTPKKTEEEEKKNILLP